MAKGNDVDTQSLHSDIYGMQSTENTEAEDVAKLKELLRQESRCHEETGQCYETLQKEYDELLKKFAEAENTIDKLRIGARIKLYYDKPVPSKSECSVYEEPRCKSVQMIALPQPQRGVMSRAYSMPEHKFVNNDSTPGTHEGIGDEESELVSRLNTLQDDIVNFQMSLSDGNHTVEEQQEIFGLLRDEYDKTIAQLKDFENQGHRDRSETMNSRVTDDYGGNNSLQAEVYRLGLRLEEINEEIVEQIRNKQRISSSDDEIESVPDRISESKASRESSVNPGRSKRSSIHSRPKSLQLNMTVDPDEKPGYNNSRSSDPTSPKQQQQQQQQFPGSFEEKYLSRSLEVPVDKSTVCSAETENKVGSWLSRENHIATSPQRRTRSLTSPPHCTAGLQSRHRNSKLQERSSNYSKLSTPERGEIKTTYTMNSTEDSGFLDGGDPRNSKSGNPRQRSLTSPGDCKYNNRYRQSVRHKIPNTGAHHLESTTDGQEYRDRLNSLRSFVDGRRQSADDHSTKNKTPRSWVRGKAPSQQILHSSSSRGSVVSEKSDAMNSRSSVSRKALNSLPREKKRVVSSTPAAPAARSFEQLSSDSNESESSFNIIEQPHESEMLESLRDEMQGVRDLVLDLKSSLHLSENPALSSTHASTSHRSPAAKKSALKHRSKPRTYAPSFEEQHHKPNHSSYGMPRQPDMVQQQMHMLGKLNETMERLSSKLHDLEHRGKSRESPSSESDNFEQQFPLKVSFEDKRDENFNLISPDAATQTAMLKDLNSRVDNLYKRLQDPPSMSQKIRSQNNPPPDRSISLSEQTRLVADMREKLNKMEHSLTPTHKEYSSHVPVYVDACPACGGSSTHRHGSYLYRSRHSPVLVHSPMSRQRSRDQAARSTRRSIHNDLRGSHKEDISTTDEELIDTRLSSSDLARLNISPSVIHHYHTFCQPRSNKDHSSRKEGEHTTRNSSPNLHSNQSMSHKSISRDSNQMSTKEIEPSNPLYDSVDTATMAAKRMESLSKRMLSTIAADLFNAKDLNEY